MFASPTMPPDNDAGRSKTAGVVAAQLTSPPPRWRVFLDPSSGDTPHRRALRRFSLRGWIGRTRQVGESDLARAAGTTRPGDAAACLTERGDEIASTRRPAAMFQHTVRIQHFHEGEQVIATGWWTRGFAFTRAKPDIAPRRRTVRPRFRAAGEPDTLHRRPDERLRFLDQPGVAPRRRTARLRLWAAAAPWLLLTGQSTTGFDPDVLWVAAGAAAPIELAEMRQPVQHWPGEPLLSDAVLPWRTARPGIEVADITLGLGAGTLADVSLVRIAPRTVRFRLRTATRSGGTLGAWSIADLAADAILALNAGQFEGGMPWGWLVRDGLEKTPPGHGPLSTAIVFDTAGNVHMVPWQEIPRHRFRREVAAAFQSYPTILDGDGHVPDAVLMAGRGVDHSHRDVRLALGTLEDGRILIAITRFGETAGYSLPWGPTVPEMAALMGSLGSRRAVLLDGGLSAQLTLRDSASIARRWPAPRRVPLALEAISR